MFYVADTHAWVFYLLDRLPRKADPFTVACIPAFNEERMIGSVVVRAMKYVDGVVVCDEGSRDLTARSLADWAARDSLNKWDRSLLMERGLP
jgi:cellulose synthase/poly-beta-1,6-N-acetylglucosamine synthase-like glycosyltransferase